MTFPWPLVEIEWQDASADPGWRYLEDVNTKPHLCRTVGWKIREGEGQVVIASSIGPPPVENANEKWEVTNTMMIPKGMIVAERVIQGV